MTTEELFRIALAQIRFYNRNIAGPWGLFVTEKKLHCMPLKDRGLRDHWLISFGRNQAVQSLSPFEREKLKRRISELKRKGSL